MQNMKESEPDHVGHGPTLSEVEGCLTSPTRTRPSLAKMERPRMKRPRMKRATLACKDQPPEGRNKLAQDVSPG